MNSWQLIYCYTSSHLDLSNITKTYLNQILLNIDFISWAAIWAIWCIKIPTHCQFSAFFKLIYLLEIGDDTKHPPFNIQSQMWPPVFHLHFALHQDLNVNILSFPNEEMLVWGRGGKKKKTSTRNVWTTWNAIVRTGKKKRNYSSFGFLHVQNKVSITMLQENVLISLAQARV